MPLYTFDQITYFVDLKTCVRFSILNMSMYCICIGLDDVYTYYKHKKIESILLNKNMMNILIHDCVV